MTKKSRKARSKTRSTGEVQRKATVKSPETVKAKPAIRSNVSQQNMSSLAVSQKKQYYYIVPELRRIAIITVGLVVILVILTFVLG